MNPYSERKLTCYDWKTPMKTLHSVHVVVVHLHGNHSGSADGGYPAGIHATSAVMSTRSRQPRKSTNTAFPRLTHVPRTRRRIAPPPLRFLASSRPFYYILQHLYISIPLPKYPPSLHSQRAHRFADTRPFVTLLYLDARIRSRTAFAAFDSFYSTFTSHLCSRTGSPFYSICTHTFYIQIMVHKVAIKTL